MPNEPTIQHYLNRVANTSIGSSTLRNQGSPGVIGIARDYLRCIDLTAFANCSQPSFVELLNKHTNELQKRFPINARSWGAARKALNIFLGEIYYHRMLCAVYNFDGIVAFLEVPLDNLVATALIERANESSLTLPKWPKIKRLTLEQSNTYQDFAEIFAKQQGPGWHRIHLDLIFWGRQYNDDE